MTALAYLRLFGPASPSFGDMQEFQPTFILQYLAIFYFLSGLKPNCSPIVHVLYTRNVPLP